MPSLWLSGTGEPQDFVAWMLANADPCQTPKVPPTQSLDYPYARTVTRGGRYRFLYVATIAASPRVRTAYHGLRQNLIQAC